MAIVDVETKIRNKHNEFKEELKQYQGYLKLLEEDIPSKKYGSLVVDNATAVVDCMRSYQTVIEKKINKMLANDDQKIATIEMISEQTKLLKMLLPGIKLSLRLISAEDEIDRKAASSELIKYIQTTLDCHPTWKQRFNGTFELLTGCMLLFLGIVAIESVLVWALFAPLSGIVVGFFFLGELQPLMNAAMSHIISGFQTFLDREPNRMSLRDKLTALNGLFFKPNDAPNSAAQTEQLVYA